MTYIFYGVVNIISIVVVLSALLNLVIGLFRKEKKKSLKIPCIWLLCGIIILYCLYFAGEYRSLNLDNATKERLLSLTITNNKEQEFIIDKEDFKYDFEVEIKIIDDDVINYDDLPYYPVYAKIYEKKFYDDDSFVLILPRESNRGFDKIPPITEYFNTIVVSVDNSLLKISFCTKENSPQIINEILDKLESMEIIASQ